MDPTRLPFLAEMNKVVDEFFDEFSTESAYPTKLKDWAKNMVDYILQDYKTMVPICMMEIAKKIKPDLTIEELDMADKVGWLYQMIEYHTALRDDFIDDDEFRFGKVSWPKLNEHSKTVIAHDDSLLRSLTYFALQKFFSHKPQIYIQLVDLFADFDNGILKSSIMDEYQRVTCAQEGKLGLDWFVEKNYFTMATHKGAAFFFTPVFLAMIITGYKCKKGSETYKNIRNICDDLGILGQVCDDYYDSFHPSKGDASATIDSDIRRGQFTWLFLLTKNNICKTEAEMQEFLDHYGKDDDDCVKYVRALYEKLDIHNRFEKYYAEMYDKLDQKVDTFFGKDELLHDIMTYLVTFVKKYLREEAIGVYY